VREEGVFRRHSLCRGTAHARFGSEVEQKVSNLVAHWTASSRVGMEMEFHIGEYCGHDRPQEERSRRHGIKPRGRVCDRRQAIRAERCD
jgi:hypothetical protein